MNALDQTLAAWECATRRAIAQVELHRVLGFPDRILPDREALRSATLAALGARNALALRVAADWTSLCAKGVVTADRRATELDTGELVAIDLVLPHLRQVSDLVEGLIRRGRDADFGTTGDRPPRLLVPTGITAAPGREVHIEVRCGSVDRLLIEAPSLGLQLTMLPPRERFVLKVSLFPGDLIFYAENGHGSIKLVRPMTEDRRPAERSVDPRFVRAEHHSPSNGASSSRTSQSGEGV